MDKITIPAGRRVNPLAYELRRTDGLYLSRVERDRTKYNRKAKHKRRLFNAS